ncbi:MAG: histidine--tRNA ligase [Elusimicrobia bacterium]|nr:histidine--tRNA ligase [Elusimicrobiota bacterium]MBP9127828.1 histidine--tRNA ligase [Elusimicrobiota bacterium]
MTRSSAPRGTRDIVDLDVRAFRRLEERAGERFAAYGYEEIRTPSFENADLFSRAVGDTTDIVEKEMYLFEDRGGRPLALRPEGTAGVVRAYLEHGWDQTCPTKKLWYGGPMFRAERPQAGRYREFWQIGGECFGNPSPQADAETLLLVRDILATAGLTNGVRFLVNSIGCSVCRPVYRDVLKNYLEARKSDLCENCVRRIDRNPLRALDCKGDGPRLDDAPLMADHLCEACRLHRDEAYSLLQSVSFPFEEAPRLVRGLDYYTRTVFEVTAPSQGSQDSIGAGGRYDGLVKLLGGPETPAVGFALGIDRVARALQAQGFTPPAVPKIFVAQAGIGTTPVAFTLAQKLRTFVEGGRMPPVEMGASTKSLKAQFRAADSWGADWLVLVGEEELKKGNVVLKDLRRHAQEEIPLAQVADRLFNRVSVEPKL